MPIKDLDANHHRAPGHEIDPLFAGRWSPRAMSGAAVDQEDLLRLFEAARWAPSSYNKQPWRFLYAHRGGAHWDTYFSWLVEFNQLWAKNAGVLILIASESVSDGQPAPTHSFDTGAAWQNLALQGERQGLVIHAMVGFDKDAARRDAGVPEEGWAVEAMVAVGQPGELEDLPERMRKAEVPSGRKPLAEIAAEGVFAALA